MLRTHNCGILNLTNVSEKVTLSGWVQKTRDLGGMTFVDLRDRYGITQLAFNMDINPTLCASARELAREFVLQATELFEKDHQKIKIFLREILKLKLVSLF